MARRVVWSERAWDDLERAAGYIGADSPGYAAGFVREVREAARSLDEFAERGRVVPDFHDPSVRELFVRNYRLIYRVGTDTVTIAALIHGARDLWALWQRER